MLEEALCDRTTPLLMITRSYNIDTDGGKDRRIQESDERWKRKAVKTPSKGKQHSHFAGNIRHSNTATNTNPASCTRME